ncbi:MAG: M20 family metallopeptidase [Nitrospirota bacterium]|nr:MAG: M20 family metallopeptidase [Nitrospirota bacterium]
MMKGFIFVTVLSLILFPLKGRSEIIAQTTSLSEQEIMLVNWVESQQVALLHDLETYVNINTGTFNQDGINKFRDMLEVEFKSLGFETSVQPGGEVDLLTCKSRKMKFADHLLARRAGVDSLKVFLNGHLDTVFAKGDEFQTITIEPDGRLKGPGVLDMKGGLVVLTYALKALHHSGRLDDANITIFLNTDEEIGSLGSRPFIEELALKHDVGLIFEGSRDHKLARHRKGLGQARIKVTGRESHAGAAHQKGVSANLELAHKVLELEALTDYSKKTTVNVGTIRGGEKRNTRPGCAEAFVDLRFVNNNEGLELQSRVEKIALTRYTHYPDFPDLPKSEVWAILHRPAKTIHPITDSLIAEAMGLSAVIGEPIIGTYFTGGGTDGSLTQAKGLPTVDSLGPNGDGAHSSREWTTTTSLMARTKLAAVLIDRLIHQ